MNNNITFGANFIKSVPIKKYIPENKIYTEVEANFVKLNPKDNRDVFALSELVDEFEDNSFANNIYSHVKNANIHNTFEYDNFDVYVLTHQKDSFEVLKPEKVLGITEISNIDTAFAEVEYLQVDPKLVHSYEPQPVKRVGSAILDCLKEFYESIRLHSNSTSRKFYLKNGFEEIDTQRRIFLWKRTNSFLTTQER